MTKELVRGRGAPQVCVSSDPEGTLAQAATAIAHGLAAAIAARGMAHWVTTGGSTPEGVYRTLIRRPLRDRVEWSRVHLWWGDDRFVPRQHELSNVGPVDRILVAGDGVPIPAANIHVVPMDETRRANGTPADAAAGYLDTIRRWVPWGRYGPIFDVVVLGIGPDGHLLSIFPGARLPDPAHAVFDVAAPTHIEPQVARVTMHPVVIDEARSVVVAAYGQGKASILAELLEGELDERRLPAQRARRAGACWFLDAAAAGELRRRQAPGRV